MQAMQPRGYQGTRKANENNSIEVRYGGDGTSQVSFGH